MVQHINGQMLHLINNDNGGAPGGNIRVGYLYNPERVTLVEGTKGTGLKQMLGSEEGN